MFIPSFLSPTTFNASKASLYDPCVHFAILPAIRLGTVRSRLSRSMEAFHLVAYHLHVSNRKSHLGSMRALGDSTYDPCGRFESKAGFSGCDWCWGLDGSTHHGAHSTKKMLHTTVAMPAMCTLSPINDEHAVFESMERSTGGKPITVNLSWRQ